MQDLSTIGIAQSTRSRPSWASIARTPIFDGWNRVHGYHLAFWETPPKGESPSNSAGNGSRIEVEVVTRGLPAFVHCPQSELDADFPQALPPRLTVLDMDVTPELEIRAEQIIALKQTGFRIALRGVPNESSVLWPLADYLLVDAERMGTPDRLKLIGRMRDSETRLVAVNVETQREFRERFDQGFDYFQGNYLFRPEPLPIHSIPPNRMVHLEILEELQKDPVDIERLSQLIKCDASLTYRLLRLVNSPLCATRQEITSIKAALLLLGENTARRFATTALAAEFNADQPSEILRIAMERARFCELAAPLAGQSASEQYLIGLISVFPAMLRITMNEILKTLPLRERTRAVLLGQQCPEALLIDWITYHEQGDWNLCESIVQSGGLSKELIIQRHAEATAWADLVLFNAA